MSMTRRDAAKALLQLSVGSMLAPLTAHPASAATPDRRLADARWIFGSAKDPVSQWTRLQARELVSRLCGQAPSEGSEPIGGISIVVGTAADNPWIQRAIGDALVTTDDLGQDDHIIREGNLRGHGVLVITGRNPRAVMYGVFAFFEQLGCRFLLSRDVLPKPDRNLGIPKLDVLNRTANSWRGFFFGGYPCTANACMSVPDYERMFDQMAKMRLNRLVFHFYENEPFVDFSFRGERKVVGDVSHPSSGYISYGRTFAGSFAVHDIPIGREKFGSRRRVAPMEFQDVESSAAALDAGTAFIRHLIARAKARGIETWITVIPNFVPLNFAKYIRPMPRPNEHWSALVSCTDPVVTEINRSRMQSVMEKYSEAAGILLSIPEGHYYDTYPESEKLVEQEWSKYSEVLAVTGDKAKLRANIQFLQVLRDTIRVAKELNPNVRLGIFAVCKAPMLLHLHGELPKDMPFVDIESGSLWGGNPLHLFQRMAGRECVLVPRAVDDGSLAGLQFNLNLYQRDGFVQSNRRNGTCGFATQLTHVRGNEHNVGFLSHGLWNDSLTPDQFYADYTQTLFGPRAASLVIQAFAILESNEAFMGGRGAGNMPWNQTPQEIAVLRRVRTFAQPFAQAPLNSKSFLSRAAKFKRAQANLTQADDLFTKALPLASETGAAELRYLIARNRGYIHHLQTLCAIADVYVAWQDAFASRPLQVNDVREKLAHAVSLAKAAEHEAEVSALAFSAAVEHATDLGVLWMVNKSMVIGTRVIRQHLGNIQSYFSGEEYWQKVDWDLLFGSTPFPTTEASRDQEPG